MELTEKEQAVVDASKAAMNAELTKFKEGLIDTKQLNERLTDELNKVTAANADTVGPLLKAVEELGLEVKALKEPKTGMEWKSMRQQMLDAVKGKDMKQLAKTGFEMTVDLESAGYFLKNVGTVTRPSSNSLVPFPSLDVTWGYTPLNPPLVRLISDVLPTALGRAAWVELGTREGAAGMSGEGSPKTQADATPTINSSEAKKVTCYWDFTEEALDDLPGFMAEMERELTDQINKLEDSQFINGVGTTVYLKGAGAYAQAYGLTTIQVETPTTWDAIIAALTQVKAYNFIPNAIMMNPVDVTNMRLAKDTTEGYLLPQLVVAAMQGAGLATDGIRIYENNNVTAGYLLVGDFTKYHIRDYKSMSVRLGYVGDNFKANIITAVGEKRVIAYVKGGEEYAFVYDTIANIKAAILTS